MGCEGRYVLISFTKLPPVGPGKYQAQIFSVTFRGCALTRCLQAVACQRPGSTLNQWAARAICASNRRCASAARADAAGAGARITRLALHDLQPLGVQVEQLPPGPTGGPECPG